MNDRKMIACPYVTQRLPKMDVVLQILAVNPSEEIQQHGLELFKNFLRSEILPIFARSTSRLEDIQVGSPS